MSRQLSSEYARQIGERGWRQRRLNKIRRLIEESVEKGDIAPAKEGQRIEWLNDTIAVMLSPEGWYPPRL